MTEAAPATLTTEMIVSVIVLLISYGVIFSEWLHRTHAALIGAVVMVGVGMSMGFYSQEQAVVAIDANTLLLLLAMMAVVTLLRPTGLFELTAVLIAQYTQGSQRRLLIYLSMAVSLISMVLDNVTTVIVFAPLTVLICRVIQVNPMPFLMSEAMLSNIGGIATLVGDPPNIMIGSAAGINFTDFLVHMGPPVVVIWAVTVSFLLWVFRKELAVQTVDIGDAQLDHTQAIQSSDKLLRVVIPLLLIIVLFFVHHHFHLYPAYAAFIGLALALVLVRPAPDELFGEIHWSVLLFFAGLFVLVGGVEATGLLQLFGYYLAGLAQDPAQLLIAGILLIWISAIVSAIVDNIPFTVTMIPILLGLETHGVNAAPLWWALALGVGLGGNGTHIGATANIIAIAEAERSGIPEATISPLQWMRVGIPTMLLGLVVASLLYGLFFSYFMA